ncbi:hypothetical protein MMC27_007706 [Xylographa pallens]|nr:hypothetical protein [Xylographa pallens]
MAFGDYDLIGDALRTQNEIIPLIRTSCELDEGDMNTEDMYLAPSPIRDYSEPPMAGDPHNARSTTPLFVDPGEVHTTNIIESIPGYKDGPKVEEKSTDVEIANTMNFAKLDDGGDPQTLMLPVQEAHIKEEDDVAGQWPQWTWKNTPKEVIVIPDDEHDVSSQTKVQMPIDEVNIKEENDSTLKWTWRNAPAEAIVITDDEDEAPGQPKVQKHNVSAAFAPARAATNVPFTKTFLLKRRQRHRPTPAEMLRMEEIQKVLAERSTGRPLIGAVGGLFKSANTAQESATVDTLLKPTTQGSATVDTLLKPTAQGSATIHPLLEPRDNDLINLELSDSDKDQAEDFRLIKKNYYSRKKVKENTEEDDILFLRAANAEKLRLSRIRNDEVQQENQDEAATLNFFLGHDENLLTGAGLDEVSLLKRPFEAITEEVVFSQQSTRHAGSQPNKRRRHKDSELNSRDSITKAKGNASKPPKPRNVKRPKANYAEDTQLPAKVEKTKKSTKRQKPSITRMTNIASLVGRDVIADAQANVDKGNQPTFKEHRKTQALRELVVSLPDKTRGIHTTDKTALLKATQSFNGQGAMKADSNGGWKLKGMKTSLYHYQLLGAAFMRNRENGQKEPLGGILADEMGFGKTVMSISCIVDGRLAANDSIKTTLIITTPALVTQWMKEIPRHTEDNVISDIITFDSSSRRIFSDVVTSLQRYDCVVTTFSQVQKSFPRRNPPKELESDEAKEEWWDNHREKYKGPLHRIMWHRIVIDEAQFIKNHDCHTAIACCGLEAKHRWLLSGTPIQNDITEFFSYFKWLKVNHIGSFEDFKKNFCAAGSKAAMARLHIFLNSLMCRRTHLDTIFGLPILKLPASEQRTTYVDFTDLERSIYDIMRLRFLERIRGFYAQRNLEKNYSHVFTLLLRLRQMTGHILIIQETIEDLLEDKDIEKLQVLTTKVQNNTVDKSIILQLRKILANSKRCVSMSANTNSTIGSDCSPNTPEDIDTGGLFGVTSVNFQKPWTIADSNSPVTISPSNKSRKRRYPSRDEQDPLKWIEMDGQLLPSAKTTAIKAQIVNWKEEAPGEKIIIFTLFHDMIRILSRIFDQEKWGYCQYHGKMTQVARTVAISEFKKKEKKGIMIASLKCGGVGLNLVMASKVFNVDLWWNSAVEQQAYCRIFRIGQESETHFQRVVVRDTIDERLLAMQKRKDHIIKQALGDDGKKPGKFSITQLLNLFGEVDLDA